MESKLSESPLISVIVPNYNNGEWIGACFDSILGQTYANIEIVVIDDSSNDNSRDVIKHYQNIRPDKISTIFLSKNVGVAKARHIGITQSKGYYITTLDADDYFADKRKLEKEIELILEYKQKYNKDVVAFSNIVIELPDGKKIIQGNENNIVQGNVLNKIISRDCMIPRDFTFSKSLFFEVGGYDLSLITHEDWDLKIRLAKKYEFYYTGISGTVYRRHNTGLSSIAHELRTKSLKRVFKKNIHLINNDIEKINVKNGFKAFLKKRDRDYFYQLHISYDKIKPCSLYAIFHAFDYYLKVYSAFGPRGISYLLKKE